MRQNSLGVLEQLQRQKSAPPIPGKPTAKWSFVAGILSVLAIALVWFALRSSRIQSAHRSTLAHSEMAVSDVHPQKTSITIPVLPGRTEAYTAGGARPGASHVSTQPEPLPEKRDS
jgi:hypothetical protein